MKKGLRIVIAVLLMIVGVYQIGTSFSDMKQDKETKEQQEQEMVDTLRAGYDKLEVGMTYDQCVDILGSEGELESEVESDYETMKIYSWDPYEDALFVGIQAYFTNDQLTYKTWMDN